MPENAVHATAGSGVQIGYKSHSSSAKAPGRITIGADISADATAAPGTTSDYNDFIFDADGTAAYTWAGASHVTQWRGS